MKQNGYFIFGDAAYDNHVDFVLDCADDEMEFITETWCPSELEDALKQTLAIPYGLFSRHPLVDALVCSVSASKNTKLLVKGSRWIGFSDDVQMLAKQANVYCQEKKEGIIFFQNNGMLCYSDDFSWVAQCHRRVLEKLAGCMVRVPQLRVRPPVDHRRFDLACHTVSCVIGEKPVGLCNREILSRVASPEAFRSVDGVFTPMHLALCGPKVLFIRNLKECQQKGEEYRKRYGVSPKVVAVEGVGVFASSEKVAKGFLDTLAVAAFSESFGGGRFLNDMISGK
jgi:hypothetical protein